MSTIAALVTLIRRRAQLVRLAWQLWGYSVMMLLPLALSGIAVAGLMIGITPMFIAFVESSRQLTNGYRAGAEGWAGITIPRPYRADRSGGDHLRRVRDLLTEPATWRDLLWMLTSPAVGAVLCGLPTVLAVTAFVSSATTLFGLYLGWIGIPVGLAITAAMLAGAGVLLRVPVRFSRILLRPAASERIEELIESRTEVVDAREAELRRIERDLHDGAQVRMVAVGMTLRTVERLLDTDPEAVRELVAEARTTAAAALEDLRSLVRGIHPPVLAERGLVDAIRAIALDTPLSVTVEDNLTGRLSAPIEAAVYFGVCELLANVVKHAAATEVTITLTGLLRAVVSDNGRGGADPMAGGGLRGVQRRLAGFDGTLAISSPEGGPTVVTMEIPCAS
jgi:signal transduction histidine kinase